MWKYNHTDELMHYGVLGMKWGVRRSEKQLARARKKAAKNEPDHEDYAKAHAPKSVRTMSNAELNERNKRLNAEQQYNKLTSKTSNGKKILSNISSATAAVTTITLGITAAENAYKAYAKYGKKHVDSGIEKLGNHIVKDIKITNVH